MNRDLEHWVSEIKAHGIWSIGTLFTFPNLHAQWTLMVGTAIMGMGAIIYLDWYLEGWAHFLPVLRDSAPWCLVGLGRGGLS